MKTVKFLSCFLIIFLISCEKDKSENDEPYIRKSEIAFGDYSNMVTNNHDTIIEYSYAMNFDIDINNDNVNDIRLISEIWGSPGLGQNPRSKIWSLHEDILLHGYFTTDTTFLNRSTRIESGPNNITEIIEDYNYTCHRIDVSDSIIKIHPNCFKIAPKDKDDVMNLSDEFKADSIIMIDDWYRYPYSPTEYGVDTVLIERFTFYNDCNLFPLGVIKYIGLKIDDNGENKLGWIKLSVINKHIIVILECSIQE